MTMQEEWNTTRDPVVMVNRLRWLRPHMGDNGMPQVSDRKLRMFGYAWRDLAGISQRNEYYSENHDPHGVASLGGPLEWLIRLARNADINPEASAINPEASADLLRHIFGDLWAPVQVSADWITPTVTALAEGLYEGKELAGQLSDALQEAEAPAWAWQHFQLPWQCPNCRGRGTIFYDVTPREFPTIRPKGSLPQLIKRVEEEHNCDACRGRGRIGYVWHPRGCHVLDAILGKA